MSHPACSRLKTSSMVLLGLVFTLLLAQPVLAEGAATDDWDLSASLYFWGPDIKGETGGDTVDITLRDILDTLDMTYMGTFGADKGKLSFLADVIYFDLSEGQNATLFQDPLITLGLTDIELQAWIVTPMAAYEVLQTDRLHLDLMVGARYLWLEADLDLAEQTIAGNRNFSRSFSNNAWYGIVGTRGKYDLNDKWYMPFHFDVGTGDTDLTWQAFVGVEYRTGNWNIGGGWRYLDFDFDDSDPFGQVFESLTINGPIIGARYDFQ